MNTSRPRRGGESRAVPGGRLCWLAIACVAGQALLSPPVAAQAPSASRQELMRKWDIDRDGKVDASEAEIARGRMRRSRNEAMMNSGTDPVTGRPRVATDPLTGRSVPPDAAAADDGLILVPGNGERPRAEGDAAARDDMPPRPARRDSEPLPGTRAPAMSSTIPSVTPKLPNGLSNGAPAPDARSRLPGMPSAAGRQGLPRPRDAGGADLSSRARVLPGQSATQNPAQNPAARSPQSLGAGQERQQLGARPGIIAGGVRAGAPGARPGYGAGGVPPDLNAGRPTSQPPLMSRPGIGPYRGPTPPGAPAVGAPNVPRPGMGQPTGVPSVTRTPNTVPRAPRMTSDEFYGR